MCNMLLTNTELMGVLDKFFGLQRDFAACLDLKIKLSPSSLRNKKDGDSNGGEISSNSNKGSPEISSLSLFGDKNGILRRKCGQ